MRPDRWTRVYLVLIRAVLTQSLHNVPGVTVLAIANRVSASQALGDRVERVARAERIGGQAKWYDSVYHTSCHSAVHPVRL